jgi:phytoene synthase
VSSAPGAFDRAYAACETLARSHYENFPVASRLLPAPMRRHIAAVYAFARVGDDIADEGTAPPAERRVRLAAWQGQLHDALSAAAPPPATAPRDTLISAATAQSIRTLRLPLALFDDLVSAFAQDITTTRYATWSDLADYCRRSANPVGRLVLRIAGYDDDRLDKSSDALCTALQLTNFWQDLGRDWAAGRLYVPEEVSAPCRAQEADLSAPHLTEAWTDALRRCAQHTADLFDRGRVVCDGVHGRLRVELRLTWLGGRRILEQVVAHGDTILHTRPALRRRDLPVLLWRACRWEGAV